MLWCYDVDYGDTVSKYYMYITVCGTVFECQIFLEITILLLYVMVL